MIKFDGFLTLYQEGQDDPTPDDDEVAPPARDERRAKRSTSAAIDASQHFTEPPPRYSEASLVKRMEELGIGRPSTYASILQVLKDRGYVRIDKKRLVPEDKGRVLTAFLESFFARYVEYDFTAGLEEQLDRISNNEIAWRDLLRDFWRDFTAAVGDIKELRVAQVHRRARRDAGAAPVPAARGRHRSAQVPELRDRPAVAQARQVRRLHRLHELSGVPLHPPVLGRRQRRARRRHEEARRGPGDRPRSDAALGPLRPLRPARRSGRTARSPSAPASEGRCRPTTSISSARSALLSLPREVGKHPEDGEPILAGIGRFGPYVQHGKTYANLETGDDVLTIGLNRAVTLIAEKKAKGPRKGRRFGADPGRALGDHPDKGGPVVVKNGRYGPYVSHDGVNATLPSDMTPETVTLEQAIALLDARAARGGGSARSRRAKPRKRRRARAAPAKAEAAEAAEAPRPPPSASGKKPSAQGQGRRQA